MLSLRVSVSMLFPPIINGRSNPSGHVWSWSTWCSSNLYSTVMVGLRRCIEAVRFLTPICDPFFGIAVAIEHFVRFNGKQQWTISCNCGVVSSRSGFQISDMMHGALPCVAVLLSSYVRISTSGSLRRRRIFDEDESQC